MAVTERKDTAVTPRQVQILKMLESFRGRYCYSPTIAELADEMSISRSTAYEHIDELRKKALLSGSPGRARSLKITAKARRLLKKSADSYNHTVSLRDGGVPLLGRITAGLPVDAAQNTESLSMTDCFGGGDDVFALQVSGDSMIEEGICDGDYVICKKTQVAREGQIVVALMDNNETTLKRFYKDKDCVRLEPANSKYQPVYTNNCQIQGVAIGLVKKL